MKTPRYLTEPGYGQKPFYVHDSITLKRVEDAIERYNNSLDNPGFCLDCGEEAEQCEPDARNYHCEHCDGDRVYGAMEIYTCIVGLK